MVDLKLALYTKTWTILHWISFIAFSLLLYLLFLIIGNNLKSFKSYRTPFKVLGVWGFYLTFGFFLGVTILYDMSIMSIKKEFFTPLSTYFNSIVRRDKETDESLFRQITGKFHANAKLGGGSKAQSKAVEMQEPKTLSTTVD